MNSQERMTYDEKKKHVSVNIKLLVGFFVGSK